MKILRVKLIFIRKTVAIDEPGGKRNLVNNISAQHKVLKTPIIMKTLIKTEIYLTDVSSLVLRHLQSEE